MREVAGVTSHGETEEAEKSSDFTHDELVQLTKTTLNTLVNNDPLLSDLPENFTLDEINAQIAVLQGTALTVNVHRADGEVLRVIVDQRDATVGHLKRALQRCVSLTLLRKTGRKKSVSWRYVWKSNWLSFNSEKLKDDNAKLRDLGITNKANVTFVKRYRDKNRNKHDN